MWFFGFRFVAIDIGADILDSTNQNVFSFGILEEQDTWWELCPNQRAYFEYMQQLNGYLREEYHSLSVMETNLNCSALCDNFSFSLISVVCLIFMSYQKLIFKDILHKGSQQTAYNLPERSVKPNKPFDAW